MPNANALAILAGINPKNRNRASAPTNLHVLSGEVCSKSEDGVARILLDGLVFSEDDSQWVEIDSLGGLEEGDIATILLSGEEGKGMTPFALGTVGGIDRLDVRIASIEADYIKAEVLDAQIARIDTLEADTADIIELVAEKASISDLNAATARIGNLEAADVTITGRLSTAEGNITNLTSSKADISDLNAATARIGALEADHVTVADFEAEQANIDTLQANTADIATIRANSAKVANLTAAELEADHATIGSLDTNFAHADMANVSNAWIENGTVKEGAITNAMINSVSANKLTAGTIDASNITVTNLNAGNITTGTINGQRIGEGSLSLSKLEEDVYTETEVDNLLETMQAEIDGAIETWTGTDIPTLQNTPAVNWTSTLDKDKHVGDVYFVVNSQSQQNGYNYRFTKSGSIYSWQLIKDSDVTAALQRLTTAEGKIGTIEQFDSDISSWKTNTDAEITSIKSAATTLSGRVDTAEGQIATKVEQSTFNTLSQTVEGNSSSITSLTTTTTALRNDLDSIEIGARNLLRHTDDPKANSEYYLVRSTANDGVIQITPTSNYALANTRSRYLDYSEFGEDDYTVSFDARFSDAETSYTDSYFGIYIGYSNAEAWNLGFGSNQNHKYASKRIESDLTTEWKRFAITIDPIRDRTGGTLTPTAGCSLRVQFYCAGATIPVEVRRVKLERGTMATDWSPAPEDSERKPNILRGTNQSIELIPFARTNEAAWSDGTWAVSAGTTTNGDAELVEISDGPDGQLYAFHAWSVNTNNKDVSQRGIDIFAANTQYQVSFYARLTPGVEQESAQAQFRLYGYNTATATSTSAAKTYAITLDSTEWKLFSYNFTLTEAQLAHENKGKDFLLGAKGVGDVQFCGVKLEQSDYVTAWAPSPFDSASITSINTVTAKVSEIDQTVDGITTRVGALETDIETKADGSTVTTISNNLSTLEQDVDGFKTTVSSTYATKTELSDAQDDLQDDIDTKASSSDLNALGTRVSTAESTIEQHGTSIALKANSADVYTKQQSDGLISTEVTNRNAAISAATDAINLSVSQTYSTKTEANQMAQPNLSPFFNVKENFNSSDGSGYWLNFSTTRYSLLGDGWAHVSSAELSGTYFAQHVHRMIFSSFDAGTYTLLTEFRNIEAVGSIQFAILTWAASMVPQSPQPDGFITSTTLTETSDSLVMRTILTCDPEFSTNNRGLGFTFEAIASGESISADIRMSLYAGEYTGPYKPYSGDLLYATQTDLTEAKAAIKVTTDGISTEVDKKVNGTEIISTINQSAETVKIQASKVDITGDVVFSAINNDTGTTKISGGKIDASSITIGGSNLATQSYVGTAVDAIAVGGRNLLTGTGDWSGAHISSGAGSSSGDTFTFSAQTSLGWYSVGLSRPYMPFSDVDGQTLTLGFDYRSDDFSDASGDHYIYITAAASATETGARTKYRKISTSEFGGVFVPTTEWQRGSITFDLSEAFLTDGSGECNHFYIQFFNHTLNSLQLRHVKLERGNKATDWTPASEDVDAAIPTAVSDLTNDTGFITSADIPDPIRYTGTCSTGASTAAKIVICDGFVASTGVRIDVTCTTANTTNAPTITIQDNTETVLMTETPLFVNNLVGGSSNPIRWGANAILHLVYDGTEWVLDERPPSYSVTCSTGATTRAKAAGWSGGAIVINGTRVTVRFSNANTYASNSVQLNFASTGAYHIYRDNAATSSTTNTLLWDANTVLTFVAQGTYWHLADNGTRTMSEEAAKTATNYIHADSAGIRIANADPDTATTYQHQTATSTEFVVEGDSLLEMGGDGVRIGKDDESRIELDYHSMQLVDREDRTYFHVSDLRLSSGSFPVNETHYWVAPLGESDDDYGRGEIAIYGELLHFYYILPVSYPTDNVTSLSVFDGSVVPEVTPYIYNIEAALSDPVIKWIFDYYPEDPPTASDERERLQHEAWLSRHIIVRLDRSTDYYNLSFNLTYLSESPNAKGFTFGNRADTYHSEYSDQPHPARIGLTSAVFGTDGVAIGDRSIAIGDHSVAVRDDSLVVGKYNDYLPNDAGDALFAVGDGSEEEIDQDGWYLGHNAFAIRETDAEIYNRNLYVYDESYQDDVNSPWVGQGYAIEIHTTVSDGHGVNRGFRIVDRSDGTSHSMNFGIGTGGVNRGIYDYALSKWMINANDEHIYVGGTNADSMNTSVSIATGLTSCGINEVQRRLNIVTVTMATMKLKSALSNNSAVTIGTIPSGYRPSFNVYFQAISASTNLGSSYVRIDSSGTVSLRNSSGSSLANTVSDIGFTATYVI